MLHGSSWAEVKRRLECYQNIGEPKLAATQAFAAPAGEQREADE